MVDDLTLRVVVVIDPVGLDTLLGRQARNVLLDERTDGSLVKRADEVEGVVGGIGRAFLENLHHAVIVKLLETLGGNGLAAPAVATQGYAQRVTEGGLGEKIPVLERCLHHVDKGVIALLILANIGKSQIDELEHGLQILDC